MHGVRPAKMCPPKLIGTPNQTIWLPRGGSGQMSGNGPSGWKMRPAARLARSLAEMARNYKARKK